jgi:integrase
VTKRARGEGTQYQRADGLWCAQVSIPQALGKPYRKTLYGKTEQEVLSRRLELLHELADGEAVSRKSVTLNEFGQEWLARSRAAVEMGHLAQGTYENYEWAWRLYISPWLGPLRVKEDLTPARLHAWVLARSREKNRLGRLHSQSSQRLMYGVLRIILNEAVRHEKVPRNRLLLVKPPRPNRQKVKPLSVSESTAFFALAAGTDLFPLWLMLSALGLRIGEALALRWSDLDVNERLVTISGSVGRHNVGTNPSNGRAVTALVRRDLQAKTPGSLATLKVPVVVMKALVKHRQAQARTRLACRSWTDQDLIFATSFGTLRESRNVLREFKALALEAGIDRNVRVHDLRHTAASHLLAEGVQIAVVKDLLRHTRIQTTSDIYAHLLEEVRSEAADAMDNRMRKILPS